jgi:hypothetical protein
MALGFQWTSNCSWDVGMQLPITLNEPLPFLGGGSSASQLFCECRCQTKTSGLQLWMPPTCLLFFLHALLSCIVKARLRDGDWVMDISYYLFLALHQTLVLHIRNAFFGLYILGVCV